MPNINISFMPEDITVEAEVDENIADVAARVGIHINASCGGEGTCGRCRIEILKGEVNAEPGLHLTQEEFDKGVRLACRTTVKTSSTLFIPEESRADASSFKEDLSPMETTVDFSNLTDPMVIKIDVILTPPSHDDNSTDKERLLMALESELGGPAEIELSLLKRIPDILRQAEFKVSCYVFKDPVGEGKFTVNRLLDISPSKTERKIFGLAIDIGTTSIWGRLIDLETNEPMPAAGDLNAQISSGEDVISRIVFAGRGDGLINLQKQAAKVMNELITTLEKKHQVTRDDIFLVVASGNTTMTQLFLAIEPKYIRLSPYVPAASFWPTMKPLDLGLELPETCRIKIIPCISSYVGGDIVAGVLSSGLYKTQDLTLFIDVGTNGEIVVGNEDWQACAACSAGPAFEGGGVKHGMRAAPGAIDDFFIDEKTLEHTIQTIGDGKALGICGSGLINISAVLFMAGVVDQRGKYNLESGSKYIREGEDGWEYLLCPASESQTNEDIALTEIDLENLVRAKGAMYSGYQTLLENVGLSMGDLDKVIIGGGFGKSLNLENAIIIGLLPELAVDKFTYIGNSSLTGSTLAILAEQLWQDAIEIRQKTTNFELSETPGYMDYYMGSQFLPHTQNNLFPKTIAMLAEKKAARKIK